MRAAAKRNATRPPRRTWALVGLVAVVVAALAACTEDPATEPRDEGPPPETFGARPDVPSLLPDDRDEPPSRLQVVDLVEGQGEEAAQGSIVTVHHAGAVWEDGAVLDSTWDMDEPFVFELGADRVIEGWEVGIGGSGEIGPMRVGGRRLLTIPAAQAYGDRGSGDDIGPDEALVYVIDLIDIEPAP